MEPGPPPTGAATAERCAATRETPLPLSFGLLMGNRLVWKPRAPIPDLALGTRRGPATCAALSKELVESLITLSTRLGAVQWHVSCYNNSAENI